MPKDENAQLNAHIPKGLHKAVKKAALDREVTIREIIIAGLSKEVNWKPKKKGS